MVKYTKITVLGVILIVGIMAILYAFLEPGIGGLQVLSIGGQGPVSDFLEVRNIYVGDFICKDTPTLTEYDLRGLAPSYIQGNYRITATQQIRNCLPGGFNGGQLVFNQDDKGLTTDYLYYQSQNNFLFNYVLELGGGLASMVDSQDNSTLYELLEQDVNILGSKCEIMNAKAYRNNGIELTLWCSKGKVVFRDNDFTDNAYQAFGAKVNGQSAADVNIVASRTGGANDLVTISTINYRVPIIVREGGDLYIAPKTCASSYLKYPQAMLNEFDICYKGLGGGGLTGAAAMALITGAQGVSFGAPNFELKNVGSHGYRLNFINNRGSMVELPLADITGGMHYGDRNNNLFFTEAANPAVYNINQGDYFVVNGQDNSLRNAFTCVVRLNSIDRTNNVVQFTDSSTGSKASSYQAGTGQGALNVCAGNFAFNVDPANAAINMDNNGDGQINGNTISVALPGGPRMQAAGMTFTINVPNQLFSDRVAAEQTSFTITQTGNRISMQIPAPQGNFDLQWIKEWTYQGLTDYGILWEWYEKAPGWLKLTIPSRQRAARVGIGQPQVPAGGIGAGASIPGTAQAGGTIVFTTAKTQLNKRPGTERPARTGYCGGGSVDPGEECDPPGSFCLYEDPVTKKTLKGKCAAGCKCEWPKPKCGNDIKERGEECEVDKHCGTGYRCIACQCKKVIIEEKPAQLKQVCGNQILEGSEQCEYRAPCPEGYVCKNCMCEALPKAPEKKGFFAKIGEWFRGLF